MDVLYQSNIFYWNDAPPSDLLPRYPIICFLYIYEGDCDALLAFSIFFFCLPNNEDRIDGASSWHESKLAFMNFRALLQWPVTNVELIIAFSRQLATLRGVQITTSSSGVALMNNHRCIIIETDAIVDSFAPP